MTAPYDVVIENGTLWTSTNSYKADIAIRDGKIAAIGTQFSDAAERIDASGLDILPGVWHVHCHFREPGHTYKEDFSSGTRAAAAGGITMCIDMTNNSPHPTTVANFEAKKALIAPKAHVDYALYAGGLYPEQIEGLAKAGAIAIKIFNTRHIKEVYPYISELGVVDHGRLHELYETIRDAGLMVAVHHDDYEWCKHMVFRDYINKGKTDAQAYHDSYEKGYMYGHAMVGGLASSLYYARIAKVRLHVLHMGVMPVGAYELIRHAKFDLGQAVTAELECGSIYMTREQKDKIGPFAYYWAHSPKEAWDSVHRNIADILVLEHAPHSVADVEPGWSDTFSVPLGITGVQEFLPILLNSVNNKELSLCDVARFTAEQPAKIFGVFPRKGAIMPGADADLSIVDMSRKQTFTVQNMLSKCGHTSWEGMHTQGMPVRTMVRGKTVMLDGKITGSEGYGRFVPGTAAE